MDKTATGQNAGKAGNAANAQDAGGQVQGSQTDDQGAGSGDDASSGADGTNGAGRTFDQAHVTRIAAREKREGASAREAAILDELGIDSLDALKDTVEEYRTIQTAVETDADRLEQRATRAERQATSHKERAETAETRLVEVHREYALRDWLRDSGINSGRLTLAIRAARADFDQIEVDAETGEVSGVEAVGKAIKKASPEWFNTATQDNGAPDLNRRDPVSDNVQPGYQRLLSAFTPGRG